MGVDELRLRMLLEHVVLLGQELLEGRELVGRAGALGKLLELEPALVVDVLGLEETARLGRVDQHRDPELAALRPDGIDPGIVHGHALPGTVDQRHPQVLVDLQAPGAGRDVLRELSGRPLAPAGLRDAGEVDVGEDHEPPGIAAQEIRLALDECLAGAAREVDHDPHADPVHLGDQLRRVLRR